MPSLYFSLSRSLEFVEMSYFQGSSVGLVICTTVCYVVDSEIEIIKINSQSGVCLNI